MTTRGRALLVVASLAGGACGGDDSTAPPVADAGLAEASDAALVDAAPDAPHPVDSGPPVDPTEVTSNSLRCGADSCNTFQGSVCCVNADNAASFCTTGPCHAGEDTYACDGHEDCSGTDVCCGSAPLDGVPAGRTSRCVGDCPYPSRSTLCHADKDCSADAPSCCFHGTTLPATGDCRPRC